MAIKINVTAKVSNLKKIRSQIESQLKNLKLSLSSVAKSGTEGKDFQFKTKQVTNLINQYKALEISRTNFIKQSKDLVSELGNENKTLASRARLTQARNTAIKQSLATMRNFRSVFAKNIQEEIRLNSMVQESIKATNQQRSLSVSQNVDLLIQKYKLGIITLDEFVSKSKELIEVNKSNEAELKNLAKLQSAVNSAQNSAASTVTRLYQQEQKYRDEIRATNQAKRQRQQVDAALNRLKLASATGKEAKEIRNIETYNAAAKRSIEIFRAGKISAQEYLQITNQLIAQQANYARMDNQIASQVRSNHAKATNVIAKEQEEQAKFPNILRQQHGALKYVNKGLKDYLGNMAMITKKFADWIFVGSLVFLPIRTMQDAVKTVIEMDDALTDLNKVVELSKSQLNDMRQAAIDLGKAMGISSAEIMRGMAEFGRIVKVKEDIIELTRVATIASNVTTLTADAAAKAITSTMITFKKDIQDAAHIVDSFNEVQNNFRVSAEDLADSIGKVGAAARQASVSMEDLEGYTAAIVSATGISGSVAGTALKSIISRTYRIGTEGESSAAQVEKVLDDIGVAVRDTSKEFRDFDSIIADLSMKWDGLSKVTKQNVAQTIAGTYHYSRFLALMENITIAEEARTKAINSENSALDENRKYLESITGRLGTLRATIEEKFAAGISVDLLKGLISATNTLVDSWGNLKDILLITLSVFTLIKGRAIQSFLLSLSKSVISLGQSFFLSALYAKDFVVSITRANVAMKLSSVVTGGLAKAVKALWALFLSNPIGIVVTAITAYVLWLDHTKRKTEELKQYQKERNDELIREQQLLEKTTKYYEENFNKIELDKQVKQELVSLQEQLISTFGDEAKHLDLINGSYEFQVDQLKKLKTEKLKAALAEMKFEDSKRQTEFATPRFKVGITGKYNITSSLDEYLKTGADVGKAEILTLEQYRQKLKDITQQIVDSGDKELAIAGTILSTNNQKYNAIKTINTALDELNQSEARHNLYLEGQKTLIEDNAFSTIQFSEVSKKAKDILTEKIDTSINDYGDAIDEVAKKFQSGGEFEQIEDQFEKLDARISTGNITWDEYREKIGNIKETLKDMGFDSEEISSLFKFQTGLQRVSLSGEEVSENSAKMKASFDNSTKTLDLLNSAMTELEDNQELSLDTTKELILNYPQLKNKLGDVKNLTLELTKLYGKESSEARKNYKDSLEASEEFYTNLKKSSDDLFGSLNESYANDLKQFKTLQQAKAELQNKIFLLESTDNILEYQQNLKDAGIEPTIELMFEFQNKDQIIKEAKDALGEIDNNLNKVANSVDFSRVIDSIEDINDDFETMIEKVKKLAGAIETLENEESLETETLLDLIGEYPQLLEYRGDDAALLKKLKQLHSEEAYALKQANAEKLTTNQKFMEYLISSNVTFWNELKNAYDTDLRNWADYMMLKEEMSREAVTVIGEQWNVDLDQSLKELDERLESVPSFAEDSGSVKHMKEVRKFVAGESMLRSKINSMLGDISFESIGFGKDEDKKEKDKADLAKVTAEKYTELYSAIDDANNALEKNRSLQEITQDDKEKIRLLTDEKSLLEDKKIATENLLGALQDEQKQNIEDLKIKYGVEFTEAGTLAESNISEILEKEEKKVNALADAKNEEAYKIANKRYEDLVELKDRTSELGGDILAGLDKDIDDIKIRKNEIKSIFEDFELGNFEDQVEILLAPLTEIDNEIRDLNNQLSLANADDFNKKIKIMGQITSATSSRQKLFVDVISTLENENYKYKKSQDAVIDKLEELDSSYVETTQSIKENTKATIELRKEQEETIKGEVKDALEEYIEFINSQIEEQIEMYEKLADAESDAADVILKDNKDKIDDLTEELKLMKELRDENRAIQEEDEYEAKIEKQKELIKNLEKEKNRRVYMEGQGFVWTVDTQAIEDEQDKLKELQQDYDNWKEDQDIEAKETEIKNLEDANEKIVEAYKKEIEALEGMLLDSANIIKNDQGVINSWDTLLSKLSNYSSTYYIDSLINLRGYLGNIDKTIKESNIDSTFLDEILNKINLVDEGLKKVDLGGKTPEEIWKEKPPRPSIGGTFDEFQRKEEDQIVSTTDDKINLERTALLNDMKINSDLWWETTNQSERDRLTAENEQIAEDLNLTKKDGVWYDEKNVQVFKKGGLVDYTGLAWLDGTKNNPERVLSSEQNRIFNNLANAIPNLAQTTQNNNKNEIFNISIDKVISNDALGFVNNLKKINYSRGKGA